MCSRGRAAASRACSRWCCTRCQSWTAPWTRCRSARSRATRSCCCRSAWTSSPTGSTGGSGSRKSPRPPRRWRLWCTASRRAWVPQALQHFLTSPSLWSARSRRCVPRALTSGRWVATSSSKARASLSWGRWRRLAIRGSSPRAARPAPRPRRAQPPTPCSIPRRSCAARASTRSPRRSCANGLRAAWGCVTRGRCLTASRRSGGRWSATVAS
mmetsp:Transcript_12822/g.39906  ORF Transcript_12822/g.39906 Transcript_12822/m.39906 type:complete len:213 (+) Transcript_12822:1683-2321(+)